MSKIGKKAITLTSAKVQVQGNTVTIAGPKVKFTHELPHGLSAVVDGKSLFIKSEKTGRKDRVLWGLHRALIANKIKGAETGFEQKVTIVGLGFKAQLSGRKMTLTLGYTHKIDYDLPTEVSVDIDKTGQQLVFKSADKFLLGNVCDAIRSFRPPEPYKGTGIIREGEVVVRKAGKTKASAA
jgi:large subunit ribosomal protein L6